MQFPYFSMSRSCPLLLWLFCKQIGQALLFPTNRVAYGLFIDIFTFDLGPLLRSRSMSYIFRLRISRKLWAIITISSNFEVAYGLSISIFKFNLGPLKVKVRVMNIAIVNLSKIMIDMKSITIVNIIGSCIWSLDWVIYISSWPIHKVKVKVMHISTANISGTVIDMWQALLLQSNTKSHMGFRLACLDLTLAYSKGQHWQLERYVPIFWISCYKFQLRLCAYGHHYRSFRMCVCHKMSKRANGGS